MVDWWERVSRGEASRALSMNYVRSYDYNQCEMRCDMKRGGSLRWKAPLMGRQCMRGVLVSLRVGG
jgi:hypothetical protein